MKKLLFPIALAIYCLFLASCADKSASYEYNQLLSTPPQECDVSEKAPEYRPDSVVATLMARGSFSYSNPSVAYVLLSNGNVLVFKEKHVQSPFTKEQAKILMLAKMKGKMLSAED